MILERIQCVWALRRRFLWVCLLSLAVFGCSRTPERPETEVVEECKQLLREGQSEEALTLLEELLERNPKHPEGLLYRAQLARESGDDTAALQFIDRIETDDNATAGTAKYLEGSLRLSRGERVAAEEAFRKSIELHPTYSPSRNSLIELLFVEFRGEDARRELLELRELRPWELVHLVQYQLALTELARPPGSQEQLRLFLKHDPRDSVAATAAVRDALAAENYDAALAAVAPTASPSLDDETRYGLEVEIRVRSGDLSGAQALQTPVVPATARTLWWWRGQAFLSEALSDWDLAAASWWQVVNRTPDDRNANYRLAVSLERAGYAEEARLQFLRTREVELLFDHVTHILAGDTNQRHLVARMAAKIVDLLIILNRPEDAQYWLDYLLVNAPGYPDTEQLQARIVTAKAEPVASYLRDEFGQRLLKGVSLIAASSHGNEARASVAEPDSPETAPIRFEDESGSAGIDFQHFNGPSKNKYLLESLGGAVTILDYDVDGCPDMYLPQGCRLPYQAGAVEHIDRLIRNQGIGHFRDVTSSTAIVENRYSQGAAAGDCDNDGFPDIFVANYGRNSCFRNMGDGTFEEQSSPFDSEPTHWSASVAWSDLNRDGALDLYVANYVLDAEKTCRTPTGELAACSPGNFAGEADLVYLNQGDGTFLPLDLEQAGLVGIEGKSLGVLTIDLDDDGWQEIYVSNDGSPNFLFRHTGVVENGIPRYREEGFISGAALSGDGRSQAGMGIAAADFSRSGRFDLYVTNFFNDYNTFYRNLGDGIFEDQTSRQGLVAPTMQLLGFGTQASDFDRDGWVDLIIANGHIDDFSQSGVPWKMPLQLFRNRSGNGWQDAGKSAGPAFQRNALGRGVACVDWNRDSHPDVAVVFQDRPMALLTNRTADDHHFLTLRLVGVNCNRDAIGARIQIEASGAIFTRELTGGDGYFATNERKLVVGLGAAEAVDRLTIRWADGTTETWTDCPVDRSLIVHQGVPTLWSEAPVE